ncbi:hypothetical protein ACSSS7_002966 [Eimeria intestinalis]
MVLSFLKPRGHQWGQGFRQQHDSLQQQQVLLDVFAAAAALLWLQAAGPTTSRCLLVLVLQQEQQQKKKKQQNNSCSDVALACWWLWGWVYRQSRGGLCVCESEASTVGDLGPPSPLSAEGPLRVFPPKARGLGCVDFGAAFRSQQPLGLSPSSEKQQLRQQPRGSNSTASAAATAATAAAAAADGLPASILDLPPSYFKGKRVLLRGDLNVPIAAADSNSSNSSSSSSSSRYRVTDDTRLRALLPTLRYLIDCGARVLLLSHFGDPKLPQQQQEPRFSLRLLLQPLEQLLQAPVQFAPACVGEAAEQMAQKLQDGEVLLLENVRLLAGEKENSSTLGSSLASLCDIYVNDAFGAAHRMHASIDAAPRAAVAARKPALAGLLMIKELQAIQGALISPARPACWIVGGSKVSTKAALLRRLVSLSSRGDRIIVGGCMALTFLKGRGMQTGASLVEDAQIDTCRAIEAAAAAAGVELLLPVDFELGEGPPAHAAPKGSCKVEEGVPSHLMALDQGPLTNALYAEAIKASKTIVWNGPMGVAENPAFMRGTAGVAAATAAATAAGAVSVVGGGDSLAAIKQLQQQQPDLQFSHLSTGGGATLKLLEGATMPAIDALCTPQQLAQLIR